MHVLHNGVKCTCSRSYVSVCVRTVCVCINSSYACKHASLLHGYICNLCVYAYICICMSLYEFACAMHDARPSHAFRSARAGPMFCGRYPWISTSVQCIFYCICFVACSSDLNLSSRTLFVFAGNRRHTFRKFSGTQLDELDCVLE